MADDNHPRIPRGGDPYARGSGGAGQAGASNDPLAELARLIGQSDPFADFGREPAPRHTHAAETQRWPGDEPAEDWRASTPQAEHYADAERSYRQPEYEDDRYAPHARYAPNGGDDDYARGERERYTEFDQAPADPYAAGGDPRYSERDPYAAAPADQLSPYGEHRVQTTYSDDVPTDEGRYADSGSAQGYSDAVVADARYTDANYSDPRYADAKDVAAEFGDAQYDEARYAAAAGYEDRRTVYAQPAAAPIQASDPYYRDELPPPPQIASYAATPFEDDSPAPRRRGGLVVVVAVLGLAFVGTAAAFGYRAMFGTSDATAQPPVIKADSTPNKVVPASPNSEPQNKLSYDRVGDRVQGEKVVVREEQPVDLKDAPTLATPRSVFPPPTGAQPPATVPATASPSAAGPASAGNEPKKVRTVTIRPDKSGGFAAVPPGPRPGAAAATNGASPFPDPPQASRGVASRSAPTPAPSAALPSGTSGEPLALAARNAPATDVVPRARSAAAPSSARAAAPTGSYSVQVSSQRTEADAEASYRALQAKFPSQLGSRDASIRRADLGQKGTFYRALVGPFSSSEQAAEFCAGLKAAGGQCLIQRN